MTEVRSADQKVKSAAVARAVRRIVDDISDRSGLGDEWGQIDRRLQAEIRRTWSAILIEELTK